MNENVQEDVAIQTIPEEIANAITHGVGALLSIAGLCVMLVSSIRHGTVWHVVSSALFGSSLFFLYLTSTLYHAVLHEKAKRFLRKMDHISIYILILGSYIPISLVLLHGPVGWVLFGIECGLCLFGILFKILFGHRYEIFSVVFYLLMGWMAVFAIKPLLSALSLKGLLWFVGEGLSYTLGVFFYANGRKYPFFHAIWHLFVLGGSACHFFMVMECVLPFQV